MLLWLLVNRISDISDGYRRWYRMVDIQQIWIIRYNLVDRMIKLDFPKYAYLQFSPSTIMYRGYLTSSAILLLVLHNCLAIINYWYVLLNVIILVDFGCLWFCASNHDVVMYEQVFNFGQSLVLHVRLNIFFIILFAYALCVYLLDVLLRFWSQFAPFSIPTPVWYNFGYNLQVTTLLVRSYARPVCPRI
jgi:hypothetical protein